MSRKLVLASVAIGLLASGSAGAHFRLTKPVDGLKTDETGDPEAGTQKTSPCGEGNPSGMATRIKAGSTLHVKLTETVAHGGHYRIALVSDPSTLDDPDASVKAGNCASAPVASSPFALPILADGLFNHAQKDFGDGKDWETDVVLPDTECPDCTLQIIEFMTPHAPGCFYHHCAKLQIVSKDAPDVPDEGMEVALGGAAANSSGGATTSSGGATTSGGAAGTSSGRPASSSDDGGCATSGTSSAPTFAALGLVGAVLAFARRRRRSSLRL